MSTRSAYVRPSHDTLSSSYRRLPHLQSTGPLIADAALLLQTS